MKRLLSFSRVLTHLSLRTWKGLYILLLLCFLESPSTSPILWCSLKLIPYRILFKSLSSHLCWRENCVFLAESRDRRDVIDNELCVTGTSLFCVAQTMCGVTPDNEVADQRSRSLVAGGDHIIHCPRSGAHWICIFTLYMQRGGGADLYIDNNHICQYPPGSQTILCGNEIKRLYTIQLQTRGCFLCCFTFY